VYSFLFPGKLARRVGLLAAGALLLARLASAQTATLLSATPRRNAPAASRTGPVQLTFSAGLDPATVGNIKVISTQKRGVRATTASVNAGTVTLALPASAPFGAGELVQVSVPATVRSTGGQPAGPLVYQFTAAVTGTGRGLFTTGIDNLAAGITASNQQLADIDGDGDLDLLLTPPAVNFFVPSTVLVRLNAGNGTFNPGPTIPVAGAPNDIALADLDGDGDLDMLASCYSNAAGNPITLSTRLNNGQGSFGGGADLPGLTSGGHLLSTADLDGDGDLDVVLSTNTAGQTAASVRFNQGNGTFAGGSELAITGGTGAFALGDIDGDGDADFMTTGFSTGGIYTCLNLGNGSFGSATTYQLGNYPASIALADIDGDGDLDLLGGCARPSTVETRLNDGQGHFAPTGSSVAVGDYPQFVRLADLDSDGDQDVLTGNLYGGSVSVRFNTNGTLGGGTEVALGKYTFGLQTGDLDGDNDIDFLTRVTPAPGTDFLGIGFNQGPSINQGPSCAAADTTATLSPAGGLTLGCGQATATLEVAPVVAGTTYEWQYAPGAGAAWQPLPAALVATYQPTQPGRYRVRLRRGGCVGTTAAVEVRAVSLQAYPVPNIFTPNGDNLNDVFALQLTAPRTFAMQIFNRWGREVFRTGQYGDFWTGAGSPEGVYYYLWHYSTDCDTTERTVRGTITLAR